MTNILLAGELGIWLNQTFASFDLNAFFAIGQYQSDLFTMLAKVFTAMGSVKYGILLGMLGGVLCLFKRTRKVGFSLVCAMLLGIFFTNLILKPLALRIRPYNALQHNLRYWAYYVGAGQLCESDFSFPSGHTSGAFTVAIPLLLCHATSKNKGAKALCWIFPIFAIATGLSRIYLMLHYATDVIAGATVGIIAGILGFAIGNGVNKFLDNRSLNGKYDAALLFKNGVKPAVAVILIAISWILIFAFSFLTSLDDGGPDTVRCAYAGEYNCQNEAKVDSKKYPPIAGKEYCKYHWELITNGAIDPDAKPSSDTEELVNTDPIPNSDFFTFLNDQTMKAFNENYDINKPVKVNSVWDGENLVTSDADAIKRYFDTLKGIQVADVYAGDTSDDYVVSLTFVMPDGSGISFELHDFRCEGGSPCIKWRDVLFELSNSNGFFDIAFTEE